MAKRVWIRLRKQGKDEVVILRKRWGWPRKWKISYYDFASISSRSNKAEADIVSAIQKVRATITAFVEEISLRNESIKEANKSNLDDYQVSTPRMITLKNLETYGEYHPIVDSELYRSALNPKWLNQLGLGKNVGKSSDKSDNMPPKRGQRTAYSTADSKTIDEHGVEFFGEGEDSVREYKEQDKAGTGGGQKAWKKQYRKEHPYDSSEWESQSDYEKDEVNPAWNRHNS